MASQEKERKTQLEFNLLISACEQEILVNLYQEGLII